MTLIPAYGRDYCNRTAVFADWYADMDFVEAESGKVINRSDIEKARIPDEVWVRYRKLTRTVCVN